MKVENIEVNGLKVINGKVTKTKGMQNQKELTLVKIWHQIVKIMSNGLALEQLSSKMDLSIRDRLLKENSTELDE